MQVVLVTPGVIAISTWSICHQRLAIKGSHTHSQTVTVAYAIIYLRTRVMFAVAGAELHLGLPPRALTLARLHWCELPRQLNTSKGLVASRVHSSTASRRAVY